jgi:hypothetical protein
VFFMSAADVAAALDADAHGAFARIAVVTGMAITGFDLTPPPCHVRNTPRCPRSRANLSPL